MVCIGGGNRPPIHTRDPKKKKSDLPTIAIPHTDTRDQTDGHGAEVTALPTELTGQLSWLLMVCRHVHKKCSVLERYNFKVEQM